MRPFEGVRVLDCTHVLAGPFATYQLAVLGADVVKVENPNEPDQVRESGADQALNQALMGTAFLTQGSNKRAIALNLKVESGREVLKRLATSWADVLVENYRPGAFKALGLGYDELSALNPRLIYASMTAFGQDGPRAAQTAYDNVVQAGSGITASTGNEASGPVKAGAQVVDYATGTTGAFAIAAALFQRARTDTGQYIDLAMLDVALILQASQITDFLHSGHHPKRSGNKMRFASLSAYPTKDGLIQLGALNTRQHRRFYEAIGDMDEAKRSTLTERCARDSEKTGKLAVEMKERTAEEWEAYLQSHGVPAMRIRDLRDALSDPQLDHRRLLHEHEAIPATDKPVRVPLAAFRFRQDGPSIERRPPRFGEHTDEVLRMVGYEPRDIDALRREGAIT